MSPAAHDSNSQAASAITPLRVLAVDDSPDDRFALQRILRRSPQPVELRQAESAHEALAEFRDRPADCVLLDYGLPDMSGSALADALRELPGGEDAAMIMLTGQGSEAIAVDAMKRGIHDYLVKGTISNESLELAIASALDRARTRRELQLKQAALEASNRELERFSTMVAHDLQSPISSMELMLHLLRARSADEPELQGYVTNALAASQGMRALVVELLDYSRAGGTVKAFEPVPLGDLEHSVRTALAGELAQVGPGALHWDATDTVWGDPVRLYQLLCNLVGNALKYSDPERPVAVTVACHSYAQRHYLTVADNGCGMTPEAAQHVFEPFTRGNHNIPGTGLGLAICRKIAEVHSGTLEVESKPGEGSVFRLTLPRQDFASGQEPPPIGKPNGET